MSEMRWWVCQQTQPSRWFGCWLKQLKITSHFSKNQKWPPYLKLNFTSQSVMRPLFWDQNQHPRWSDYWNLMIVHTRQTDYRQTYIWTPRAAKCLELPTTATTKGRLRAASLTNEVCFIWYTLMVSMWLVTIWSLILDETIWTWKWIYTL